MLTALVNVVATAAIKATEVEGDCGFRFSVPVPRPPAAMLKMRPPFCTSTPPPKVLAPVSIRLPAPVLRMPVVLLFEELPTTADRFKVGASGSTDWLFTVTAPTLKVRVLPLRSSSVPEMTPGAATLEEVAMTLPASRRLVPTATVGEVPPMELRVRPARVLVPNRVSVELPLRTGALPALIWFWPTVMVTIEPLSVRPPTGITTVFAALLRVSVVPSRIVPPV